MRLELADGQWAELRERLTYAQAREIRATLLAVDEDHARLADLDLGLVRAYVSSWHVLDLEANAVALDQPQSAPDDVIQAIAVEAMRRWQESAAVPKAGNGISASLPLGAVSGDPIPISAKLSSSSITPAGAGET